MNFKFLLPLFGFLALSLLIHCSEDYQKNIDESGSLIFKVDIKEENYVTGRISNILSDSLRVFLFKASGDTIYNGILMSEFDGAIVLNAGDYLIQLLSKTQEGLGFDNPNYSSEIIPFQIFGGKTTLLDIPVSLNNVKIKINFSSSLDSYFVGYFCQIKNLNTNGIIHYEKTEDRPAYLASGPINISLYTQKSLNSESILKNSLDLKLKNNDFFNLTYDLKASTEINIDLVDTNDIDTVIYVSQDSLSSIIADSTYVIGDSVLVDGRDGQTYRIIEIGNQIWMAENLNYRITTNCTGSTYYNLDSTMYAEDYGRLYTEDVRNQICPEGWVVPSKSDFDELISYLGGDLKVGEALIDHSKWANITASGYSNSSGFDAQPSGSCGTRSGFSLDFSGLGTYAIYLTSDDYGVCGGATTDAIYVYLNENGLDFPVNCGLKLCLTARAVRCIKEP